eukprot:4087609-Pleurochrysis_carterae.AAC.1
MRGRGWRLGSAGTVREMRMLHARAHTMMWPRVPIRMCEGAWSMRTVQDAYARGACAHEQMLACVCVRARCSRAHVCTWVPPCSCNACSCARGHVSNSARACTGPRVCSHVLRARVCSHVLRA